MPFNGVQSVLKRMLPESVFESLYNRACNAYDVWQSLLDNIYYHVPTMDEDEALQKRILRTVKPYTMTSRVGLLATYSIVVRVIDEGVRGAFVECGVARGGCAALMALVAYRDDPDRNIWLFDSFEGLPEQSKSDGEQKPIRHDNREANDLAEGYCLGTFNEVYNMLYHKLKLSVAKVVMVKGWFQDTLPEFKEDIGEIAVLRLDGDWYESTKCCLENLYGKVVKKGWVIIDDYQLQGCRKAVDEFLQGIGSNPIMSFDDNGRAYWQK